MTRPSDVYLAFASGAVTYDCAPCGRCCRDHGLADDLVRIGRSSAAPMLPWLNAGATDMALATVSTFADGCRFLADDHLCDIHRHHGAQAKPRICRLFPYSRLEVIDDLWTLLPQTTCPWRACAEGDSDQSAHGPILRELDNDTHDLLSAMRPLRRSAVTPLPPQTRRAMEEHIRDALVDNLADMDGAAARQLSCLRSIQSRHAGTPLDAPQDPLIWLDLLRSAGEPAPLAPAIERLLAVAMPALRARLVSATALPLIPNTLAAFALWLRCLAELPAFAGNGENMLHVFEGALPLVRLMAMADLALPQFPSQAPDPILATIWPSLCARAGEPIGEAVVAATQPYERGALPLISAVGALLGPISTAP